MVGDLTGGPAGHQALEAPETITPAVREAVLMRDHYACQVCGTTGDNRLQLHHVQFRSAGGGHHPENLVTVCARDHEAIHRREIFLILCEVAPGQWAAFVQRRWRAARRTR